MATLPIFIAHIQAAKPVLGPHRRKSQGYRENPATLGDRLRNRRLELNLRQKDLARRFGVTVACYNTWECGRCEPKLPYWREVISFLGFDPSPPPSTLKECVHALQRMHGLDIPQLVRRLGIGHKTLYNWLSEKYAPYPRTRQKITKSGLAGAEMLLGFL